MTKRVLVTGATGGLGLSLVEELAKSGRSIIATGRRPLIDARLQGHNIIRIQADLSSPATNWKALLEDVETVFHCAALSSPWGKREEFDKANILVTSHLLAHAESQGVKKFIHVSSPSIYADMRDRQGISEESEPAMPPLNHYAATKLISESLAIATDGEMKTAVIRPRGIIGPDDTVVLPRLAALVNAKRIPLVRGGHSLVQMIDVRDVVSALLLAEQRIDRIHGEAINIAGSRPVSIREAATELAKAMERRPRFVHVPLRLAKAIAALNEWVMPEDGRWGEPRLTRYSLATIAYTQTLNLDRAYHRLGWEPKHDGFKTLIEQARKLA